MKLYEIRIGTFDKWAVEWVHLQLLIRLPEIAVCRAKIREVKGKTVKVKKLDKIN